MIVKVSFVLTLTILEPMEGLIAGLITIAVLVPIFIIMRVVNNTSVSAGKVGRIGDIKCPRCKEFVKHDAEVCKHCGFDQVQSAEIVAAERKAAGALEVAVNERESRNKKFVPWQIVCTVIVFIGLGTGAQPILWLGIIGLFVVAGMSFAAMAAQKKAKNKS